jgi:hypothetical protein
VTSEELVRATFTVAGIRVARVWRLPNGYLGDLAPLADDQIERDRPGTDGIVHDSSDGPTDGVVRAWMRDYRWRHARPAWLVLTSFGLVEIGWRKRVIAIDWRETAVRALLTTDDVTISETHVHAWSEDDAVRYLRALGLAAKSGGAQCG